MGEVAKGCPGCGGRAEIDETQGRFSEVRCTQCGLNTGLQDSTSAALTLWNTRHADPLTEALDRMASALFETRVVQQMGRLTGSGIVWPPGKPESQEYYDMVAAAETTSHKAVLALRPFVMTEARRRLDALLAAAPAPPESTG